MFDRSSGSRRRFVKFCASAIATVTATPELLARTAASARSYARVRLVDENGAPLKAASLVEGETYVFAYPYVSTPCFLLDLGRPAEPGRELATRDGEPYRWQGGVGPGRSVVAFSAICAHKMSHPAKSVSFINYRHQRVNFVGLDQQMHARESVIYCCSERSVYDAADGARVLGGPAPQPLAAIELEYDASEDALYARGSLGGEMYQEFMRKFGFRLQLELGVSDVSEAVTDTSKVIPLSEFSKNQTMC